MKIFLTGATGFIGSNVARALVQGGHEVHALVRPQSDQSRIADLPLRLIAGDLLNLSVDSAAFDCCVHLAWYVEPGQYLTSPLNRDYVRASLALARRGFPRFVGAGTCFELTPTSIYAAAKRELFDTLATLGGAFAWGRFHYQYGPFEHPKRLVPIVINSLLAGQVANLTTGERLRDYLHVADVGTAVAAVATSQLTGAVNIGSGVRMPMRTVTDTIGQLVGRPELLRYGALPYRADEPGDILADITTLRSTGWRPRYNLTTGLQDTIEWWRQPHRPIAPAH